MQPDMQPDIQPDMQPSKDESNSLSIISERSEKENANREDIHINLDEDGDIHINLDEDDDVYYLDIGDGQTKEEDDESKGSMYIGILIMGVILILFIVGLVFTLTIPIKRKGLKKSDTTTTPDTVISDDNNENGTSTTTTGKPNIKKKTIIRRGEENTTFEVVPNQDQQKSFQFLKKKVRRQETQQSLVVQEEELEATGKVKHVEQLEDLQSRHVVEQPHQNDQKSGTREKNGPVRKENQHTYIEGKETIEPEEQSSQD